MVKPEDLLQERLERLEAGELLEVCLEGVPDDIAVSIKTAARLSTLEWPASNPERIAAERSNVTGALQIIQQIRQGQRKLHQRSRTIFGRRGSL